MIREKCLCPFVLGWEQPTPEEVRQVLKEAGLSGKEAANLCGLGKEGSRTVRRWTGGESRIPYTAWAILCYQAGYGVIWESQPG